MLGKFVGIDFAPTDGFAGGRAAQASGIGAGVGDLQEKIMPLLLDTEHFLDLGFGLKQEIFWGTAPEDENAAFPACALGVEHDCRRFIDVRRYVEREFPPRKRHSRNIHADGRIPRRGSVHRHTEFVRRTQDAVIRHVERFLGFQDIFPRDCGILRCSSHVGIPVRKAISGKTNRSLAGHRTEIRCRKCE